jgi:predicted nucleic acid-binding protein
VRAVLDPNVLISALISPAGAPREIVTAWTHGSFDLIASPLLLDELHDVLARPRFRRWVSTATVATSKRSTAANAPPSATAARSERSSIR